MAGDREVPEATTVILKAMRGELTPRELSMIGYSPDTKAAIVRAIEACPALEETFLLIADLAYTDGITAL